MLTIHLTVKALRTAIALTLAFILVSIVLSYLALLENPSSPDWSLSICILVIVLIYYIYIYILLHSILLNLFDNGSFKLLFFINIGVIILSLLALILNNNDGMFFTGLLLLITGLIIFVKFISIYKTERVFLMYGSIGITSMILSLYFAFSGLNFISSILTYTVNIGTIFILSKAITILRDGKQWHIDLRE